MLLGLCYERHMSEPDAATETNRILMMIWTEMKALNGRIDQTNARLDATNARLDATNARLEAGFREMREEFDAKIDDLRRQMVEADMRVATAVAELAADVRALTRHLREGRPQLVAHEERITKLEARVDALENKQAGG